MSGGGGIRTHGPVSGPTVFKTPARTVRLQGIRHKTRPRAQAYAKIDLALTRDTVPRINFANIIQQDFFSARIGCQLYQPMVGMDLGALRIRTAADTKRSVP